ETRVIDTVYRIDHQINANNSWGARWITEWSPQKNQTNNAAVTLTAAQQEWDRDDTGSIHFNSVMGNNRVNTIRLSLTREDDRFAPNGFPRCQQNVSWFFPLWSADFDSCVDVARNAMRTQGPNLTYLTFQDGVRNAGTHWITDSPEFSDTFSLYKGGTSTGDHDMKMGFQMYYVRWNYQNNATLNGTFTIPSNNSFTAADPRTYPERLTIQAPTDQVIRMTQWAYTGFFQDKWHFSSRSTLNLGVRYDIDFTPLNEVDNPAFSDP